MIKQDLVVLGLMYRYLPWHECDLSVFMCLLVPSTYAQYYSSANNINTYMLLIPPHPAHFSWYLIDFVGINEAVPLLLM